MLQSISNSKAASTALTWTVTQHPTTFNSTTAATSVTTTSTTAGNLLILWSAVRYTGTGFASTMAFSAASDNGTAETWVHCPQSVVNDALSSDGTLYALDCWYVLSAAGGATSVTATWTLTGLTGSSQKVDVDLLEVHPSSTPIYYDTGNAKYNPATCSSCTGPAGLLSGTSDFVSQAIIYPDLSGATVVTGVGAPYSNPTDIENTNHVYAAFAGALNQSSYSVPTWTSATSIVNTYSSSVAFSGNASPAPSGNMFIDFSSCSNGSALTVVCVQNSTTTAWGTSPVVDISSMGTGSTAATSVISSNLPATTTINGAAKTGGSTLDFKGVTSATGTAVGFVDFGFGSVGGETMKFGSMTVGYTYRSSCVASGDCGAMVRLIDSNGNYAVGHASPSGNAKFCLESSNGGCKDTGATYAINTNYRINMLKVSSPTTTAGTVTFTNGSAVITFTNTFVAGQGVQFKTTGTLPTNFAINTTYYVIATGLSGSQFEVSATLGGSAITAGSAGSGTQSVLILGINKMTVCNDSTGAVLGTAVAPADALVAGITDLQVGINGQEPTTVGYVYYFRNVVVNGIYSTTSCF